MSVFDIDSGKICLSILDENNAHLAHDYYLRNRTHLSPWTPTRDDSFYEIEEVRLRMKKSKADFLDGLSANFSVIDKESLRMIGECNFTNICRGPFQACNLGYSISADHEGKGLMFAAVSAGIAYAFDTLKLHRIMANHMPDNERSAKLLRRLGFEREGYAKSYLEIAGIWQDHILNSLVNPKHSLN